MQIPDLLMNTFLFSEGFLNSIHIHAGAWLDQLIIAITWTGDELFYTLAFPVIYWTMDRKLALVSGFAFLISMAINDSLKVIFGSPRPHPELLDEPIRQLAEKMRPESNGFPSGHTQGALSFWGSLAWFSRNRYVILAAIFFCITVPYSRMFLGVHYAGDVAGGILVSIIILPLLFLGIETFGDRPERMNNMVVTILALVVPFLLFLVMPGHTISRIMGMLSGFLVGAWWAMRTDNYRPSHSFLASLLRILAGFTVLFVVRILLKKLLPDMEFSHYLRYAVIGLWIAWGAPWLFRVMEDKLFPAGRDA